MSYQVLSLKWRPQSFEDVIGQEHVTQTLLNAFKKDRVAQGYMLTGPRGVGKTTTARIIAKALNCPQSENGAPCNQCNNCQEITDGRNLDVIEIDGASNRGIEEIRNLREAIKYAPMNAPCKIFIIDEVHMLTNQAFNALLRTLEEPPPHGKFILATTDIHKVPSTIISRCQRFDFNRITDKIIQKRLVNILKEEKIAIDDESLAAIAGKADGSMRDALSLLDQVIAYAGEKITFEDVSTVIGLIPMEVFFEFSDAVLDKNADELLDWLQTIRRTGMPLEDVAKGLNQHFRNLLVSTINSGSDLLEMNEEQTRRYSQGAKNWNSKDLLRTGQLLNELERGLKRASQPEILFEMTAFKLLEMDRSVSIEALLSGDRISPDLTIEENSSTISPLPEIKGIEKKENQKISTDKMEDRGDSKKRNNPTNVPEIQNKEMLTLEEINEKWASFVVKVSSKRQSIGTVLEHTLPASFEGNRVTLHVFDLPKFSVATLDKNKSVVESFLEEHYGVALRMRAEWREEEISESLQDSTQQNKEEKNKKGDPVISRIIEQFDGEILR